MTGKPEVTRLGREERNVREKGSSPQQWKRQIPNPQPNPQECPSFMTSAYFGSPPRCCMLLYNLITQRCDGRGRFSMQVHDGLTLRFMRFRQGLSPDSQHAKRTEKLEDRCLPHAPVDARDHSQVLNVSAAKTATSL